MPLKNSPAEYGAITKTFHWGMALIVICLLALGLTMEDFPLGIKPTAYGLHKSFGVTVLALIFCRALWHVISKKPGPIATLKPWEKNISVVLHYGFYVLLVVMPLSGWLFSSAAGRPVSFFGLFTLPDLIAPDKGLKEFFSETHEIAGNFLIAAVGLHIAAALKHHLIDKDTVLRRMLPAALLFLSLILASPSFAGDVQKWNILNEKSSITFRPKQMGAEFKGTFAIFGSEIFFDADKLAASRAVTEVHLDSVSTGAVDRDETMKGKEWFDVTRFPIARFETKSFRKTGPNTYEAEATLTIRDITLPLVFPFTLKIAKAADTGRLTAVMDGTITLDRAQFKIGTGQWADPSLIANEVPVDVHVVAIHAD